MTRAAAFAVQNTFNKGLLTHYTGLNFPEDACTDALNCVFESTGAVQRRLGFDYEIGYLLKDLPIADNSTIQYTSYFWKNVSNSADRVFVVIQLGDKIKFFSPDVNGAISTGENATTLDLNLHSVSGSPSVNTEICTFAEGNGYLFIAHPYCDPISVSYETSTDTFTFTNIALQIRDVQGVDDGTIIDTRLPNSSPITATHHYNLLNQGWGVPALTAGLGANPYDTWVRHRDDYPSNADVWWLAKNINDIFTTVLVDKISRGNTQAPRGHYILSAFNQDRETVSGISGVAKISSSYYRPGAIAFFGGRVWYAGVNATNFSNNVYFSQIIRDPTDFYKCYQKEDPTNEALSDLLPSDGGVVKVVEAARILYLLPMNNSLYVFATNGIWSITGSQGLGFLATDYSVNKVGDIGALSNTSFVNAAGTPFWWNTDGIYTLQTDKIGNASAVSVTETTIKEFYGNIPLESRRTVKGTWSLTNKEIIWVYQDDDTSIFKFLSLRLQNGAFSPLRVSANNRIVCVIAVEGFANNVVTDGVTNSTGVSVTSASGSSVFVNVITSVSLANTFKAVVINQSTNKYTIAGFSDTNLVDWASTMSTQYSSYFTSGYKVRNQAIKLFNVPYIQTYIDLRTYPAGSCYLEGIWDYATSTGFGITNKQQVYNIYSNSDYGFSVRKIRGNGYAVQLKYSSKDNNPFHIIGWSEFSSGSQSV